MRYCDLDIADFAAHRRQAVLGRIAYVAHGMIKAGHTLALAWPQYSAGSMGNRLRVFILGDADDGLASETELLRALNPLISRNLIHASAWKVPPESRLTVRYKRNRRLEKELRRIKDDPKRVMPPHDAEYLPNNINMFSDSTRQNYNLFVDVEWLPLDNDDHQGNGSAYGLSHILPHF